MLIHNSGIKPPQCWIYPTGFSNPDNKQIKILVQPNDVPYVSWSEYAEGELDKDGNIQFYSQQDLIDNMLSMIN